SFLLRSASKKLARQVGSTAHSPTPSNQTLNYSHTRIHSIKEHREARNGDSGCVQGRDIDRHQKEFADFFFLKKKAKMKKRQNQTNREGKNTLNEAKKQRRREATVQPSRRWIQMIHFVPIDSDRRETERIPVRTRLRRR